jgi:type IV pilus assembly protein PilX
MTSPLRRRASLLPSLAARGQYGAVLVVGLIFLALLTLIGITAYSVATQEERMAGNARDRLRAFEAAEAALRACENRVRLMTAAEALSYPPAGYPEMYDVPAAGMPDKWESMNWVSDASHQLSGVDGVAEQPRCIVQRQARATLVSASQRAELPQSSATTFAYQITARGVGANRDTVVLLQSSFVRD